MAVKNIPENLPKPAINEKPSIFGDLLEEINANKGFPSSPRFSRAVPTIGRHTSSGGARARLTF